MSIYQFDQSNNNYTHVPRCIISMQYCIPLCIIHCRNYTWVQVRLDYISSVIDRLNVCNTFYAPRFISASAINIRFAKTRFITNYSYECVNVKYVTHPNRYENFNRIFVYYIHIIYIYKQAKDSHYRTSWFPHADVTHMYNMVSVINMFLSLSIPTL